jgi:hypothetical protein
VASVELLLGGGEPRCAKAVGTTYRVGVTWERVDAEDGVVRRYCSVDRPGTPRLSAISPVTGARPGVVTSGGAGR